MQIWMVALAISAGLPALGVWAVQRLYSTPCTNRRKTPENAPQIALRSHRGDLRIVSGVDAGGKYIEVLHG